MKISVIGCGYLGAVHAACMAVLGHDVVGIDVDPDKVAMLSAGAAPFFEPGLPEMLAQATARTDRPAELRADREGWLEASGARAPTQQSRLCREAPYRRRRRP